MPGSSTTHNIPPELWLGWVGVAAVSGATLILVATMSPDENPNRSTVDSVTNAFSSAAVLSGDALVETLGYLFFFTMLPLMLFWFKILAARRSAANESVDHTEETLAMDRAYKWLHQGKLIAFILQVLIIVYLLFHTLERIGIPVDGLIQIGTVFSLGLSWSMRSWLSSLWAGFMVAFTTNLTANCVMRSREGDVYIVRSTGLMFMICERCSSVEEAFSAQVDLGTQRKTAGVRVKSEGGYRYLVHLPNSSFIDAGFTLVIK